jgi:hypothetical protein
MVQQQLREGLLMRRYNRFGPGGRFRPKPQPKYLLVSGDFHGTIDLVNFLDSNKDSLDEIQIQQVLGLGIGEELMFGGGTAGESTLTRIE